MLGNQEAIRGPKRAEDARMGDEARREGLGPPRQPLCQNRKERGFRPVRIGLPAGEERTSQPTEVLLRTEEIVMLIGTAVCGKPHVRWCERAGEIKTSPLYSILSKSSSGVGFSLFCALGSNRQPYISVGFNVELALKGHSLASRITATDTRFILTHTRGKSVRKRVGIPTINKWSAKTTTAQVIGDTVD